MGRVGSTLMDLKISQLGIQAANPNDFFVLSRNGKLFKIKRSNMFLGIPSGGQQRRFFLGLSNIFLPTTMNNLLRVLFVYITNSSNQNPSYDIDISYFSEGENSFTSQSTNFTPPSESSNTVQNVDITSAFSGVTAGDIIGVKATVISGSLGEVVGLELHYD